MAPVLPRRSVPGSAGRVPEPSAGSHGTAPPGAPRGPPQVPVGEQIPQVGSPWRDQEPLPAPSPPGSGVPGGSRSCGVGVTKRIRPAAPLAMDEMVAALVLSSLSCSPALRRGQHGPPSQVPGDPWRDSGDTSDSGSGGHWSSAGSATASPPHGPGSATASPPHCPSSATPSPPHSGTVTVSPPHCPGSATLSPPHRGGSATVSPPHRGGSVTMSPPHCPGSATLSPPHRGGSATVSPPHCPGSATVSPPHRGGSATSFALHCPDAATASLPRGPGSATTSPPRGAGSATVSPLHCPVPVSPPQCPCPVPVSPAQCPCPVPVSPPQCPCPVPVSPPQCPCPVPVSPVSDGGFDTDPEPSVPEERRKGRGRELLSGVGVRRRVRTRPLPAGCDRQDGFCLTELRPPHEEPPELPPPAVPNAVPGVTTVTNVPSASGAVSCPVPGVTTVTNVSSASGAVSCPVRGVTGAVSCPVPGVTRAVSCPVPGVTQPGLSHSAPPGSFWHIQADHAYQALPSIQIPVSPHIFTSISWATATAPLPPARSRSLSLSDPQTPQPPPLLQPQLLVASPPRASLATRKIRGEAKKCRKVYGIERREQWCTACRWKKACQRFLD